MTPSPKGQCLKNYCQEIMEDRLTMQVQAYEDFIEETMQGTSYSRKKAATVIYVCFGLADGTFKKIPYSMILKADDKSA